jgi:LacI family transcriptional regulator
MAATIKEIAGRLNVSVASVSRALNDLPGVGDKTRRKILKAAGELGYVPDFHARALVSGKVPFLGLVVPDITNSFFPALALAVEEAASAAGLSTILLNTNWRADRLRQSIDLLASRRVAGLILCEPLVPAAMAGVDLAAIAPNMVLAGVEAPVGAEVCAVCVDDRDGGRQVGSHLAGRGVKSVAFVGGPKDNRASALRLEGLRDGLAADGAGSPAMVESVTNGPWTEESGYLQAGEILASGVPDAVFAANDLLALGVMRRFSESGIQVGRGAALAGYDNTFIVSLTSTPVTSVDQPTAIMGAESVRCLTAQLETGRVQAGVTLKPSLAARASTLDFNKNCIAGTSSPEGV